MQSYIQTYPLHSSSPLTVPKFSTWEGITIEHHLQPPAECELCLPKHTICILLSDCQTERRVNGGRLHCNHAKRGEIIVYPATSEHWVRWQEQAEFLLLFLEPDLVARTADELASRNIIDLNASCFIGSSGTVCQSFGRGTHDVARTSPCHTRTTRTPRPRRTVIVSDNSIAFNLS